MTLYKSAKATQWKKGTATHSATATKCPQANKTKIRNLDTGLTHYTKPAQSGSRKMELKNFYKTIKILEKKKIISLECKIRQSYKIDIKKNDP